MKDADIDDPLSDNDLPATSPTNNTNYYDTVHDEQWLSEADTTDTQTNANEAT